jgi:hypothetical protein
MGRDFYARDEDDYAHEIKPSISYQKSSFDIDDDIND